MDNDHDHSISHIDEVNGTEALCLTMDCEKYIVLKRQVNLTDNPMAEMLKPERIKDLSFNLVVYKYYQQLEGSLDKKITVREAIRTDYYAELSDNLEGSDYVEKPDLKFFKEFILGKELPRLNAKPIFVIKSPLELGDDNLCYLENDMENYKDIKLFSWLLYLAKEELTKKKKSSLNE